jgi:signal transduction histidine kinase
MGAIVHYWIYEFYLHSSKEALVTNIELLSDTITKDINFNTLAKQIKKNLQLRLTVIDSDGNILAESDKDKSTMENHRYRPEIMQADHETYGSSIRHSHTLQKDMLYVAKKIQINHKTIYLRLAKELKGIYHEFINLSIKISAVLILFFIILFIMSYKINKQIQNETNKIVTFLKALTKKEKPTYISSKYSQEFALITSLLTKVSKILAKKEKQQEKYTRKLQNANAQKDDIISAISHEFKNPIAVVNGYAQTLLEDENLNLSIRKKFLSKIYSNGLKLSNLIDTLRLSIKLEGGQLSLNKTDINLYETAQECASNLQINYPYRKVIIEGSKEIAIKADKTLMDIVITNLIENAFKYSEDEVHIIITKNQLTVQDSGMGISEKNIKNITEKFYRVQTNRWNNSLGLGLFLVNKIVKLHNFKLKIKSQVNKGSDFILEF